LDLPNAVTLSGLAAGLWALGLVVQAQFGAALALALIAIVIDQLDGYLAVRRPQRSPAIQAFGAHLDCYADFVSKGIFPALMLLGLGGFGAPFWAVALLQVGTIAVRYSYEFVPHAPRRGLSPDFSLVIFGILYLGAPLWGDRYPAILAVSMVVLAGLNLAPFEVPKLKGPGLGAFIIVALALIAALFSSG
jgi:CDP-diacylglycerol--serine O-phosphatidyltransferase